MPPPQVRKMVKMYKACPFPYLIALKIMEKSNPLDHDLKRNVYVLLAHWTKLKAVQNV